MMAAMGAVQAVQTMTGGWANPIVSVRRFQLAFGKPPLTLGSFMERIAGIHGERHMVSERGDDALSLTFGEAARLVDAWAGWFAGQVQPGERVVLATPNGYGQLFATLAVARAGAIPAPVNPHMSADEIAHVIADTHAALVVTSTDQIGRADPLGSDRGSAEAGATSISGDTAALFYTSGTTGKPKGAALSHAALVGQLGSFGLAPMQILDLAGGFEAVLALPIAHIMGFVSALGAAAAGVRVRSIPRFNPLVVLDEIEERRCAMFVGVPTMYRMLDAAGASERDLRCVHVWGSGADVMPTELAAKFKAMGSSLRVPLVGYIGEATFVEGYGMVEVGGGAMAKVSPPFTNFGLGESLGIALPGYNFRVVDDDDHPVSNGRAGELQLQGPGVLNGYWGDSAATAGVMTADGWLRTGDQVIKRPLGGFSFQGRSKNTLKVGGYSVYPPEIEAVIELHPSVVEVAVVGAPDDRLGEVPVGVVVLKAGARTQPETLQRWVAKRLADYKAPRRIIIVESLPHTGTGKVQRGQVRAMVADRDSGLS